MKNTTARRTLCKNYGCVNIHATTRQTRFAQNDAITYTACFIAPIRVLADSDSICDKIPKPELHCANIAAYTNVFEKTFGTY